MTPTPLPIHDRDHRRFVLTLPEGEGVLEYELADTKGEGNARTVTVVFTHTFVPETLRGRGVAAELVRAGLKWAQSQSYRVEATCSYVVRYLETHSAKNG